MLIKCHLSSSESKEVELLAKSFGISPQEMLRQLAKEALLSPPITRIVESFGDRVRIRGMKNWRQWTRDWRKAEASGRTEGGDPGANRLQGISPSAWTGPLPLSPMVSGPNGARRLTITVDVSEEGFGVGQPV